MVDPNQNFILSLKKELNECSYARSMTDYLANMIIRIMNYPKKTIPSRYFVKVTEQNKIIFIWYPMSVPFKNKNFNIPIQIFITKNIPYEPPQIFLEVGQGSAPSTLNKDIDQNNNRIMTQGLRNWNQYSNVENVLGEIFESFSKAFPLYKKKPTQQQTPAPTPTPNSGGYGNNNNYNNNYNNTNNNKINNNYNKNYNNNNYNNNTNNNINNNYNNNNNYSNNNNDNNNYNTSNKSNKHKRRNKNKKGDFSSPPVPTISKEEIEMAERDLKIILLNEIYEKVANKIIKEEKKLKYQNRKMKDYKNLFTKENEKLQEFVKRKEEIETKCEEDMDNIIDEIEKVEKHNSEMRNKIVDEENCLDFLEIPDTEAIKIIGDETSLEEMIIIVRKAFEKKKVPFEEAVTFMRNSYRDLYELKFRTEKVFNKYKYA